MGFSDQCGSIDLRTRGLDHHVPFHNVFTQHLGQCFGRDLRAPIAARTGLVLHHKTLACDLGQFGRQDAGYKLVGTASRLRYQQGDGFCRVCGVFNLADLLRPGAGGDKA